MKKCKSVVISMEYCGRIFLMVKFSYAISNVVIKVRKI